jgi:hypothetical protein
LSLDFSDLLFRRLFCLSLASLRLPPSGDPDIPRD